MRKQAANKTKEPFANSLDLRTELLNAILGTLDAHNLMSTQALPTWRRMADQPIPRVRRVRMDPMSGDLIVPTEAKGQVPLRIELSPENLTQTILDKVLWVLRRMP